jgi:sulfoacetaldehyde acetyltransferase
MLGLVKKVDVGICGDAKAAAQALLAAAGRPHAGLRRHQGRARRAHRQGKGRLGAGTERLDARARRLQPGHDRRGQGREDPGGGQWLHPRQVLRELEKAMPRRT